MKKIFFDVGANSGSEFIDLAKNNKDIMVYAFEPTPEMCEIIKTKAAGLNNYRLIEKAVSNYEGKATFHVAGQRDWGCSSLLQFSDKSKTKWPGRLDFVVTKIIEVDVIRLDKFIEENNINTIEYLHVDTQGSDLNVLIGLGHYLHIVKQGVIEAANKEDILYFGQNTKDQCIDFLNQNGFIIDDISCNDEPCNEINIKFSKK